MKESLTELADLFFASQEDPYSLDIWKRVTELAQQENSLAVSPSLPLVELIEMGEKIRAAKNLEERYRLLSRRCLTGEVWYNIILGWGETREGIMALYDVIRRKAWHKGLDVGCGIGNSLRPIARHCEKIYGLDIFPFMLEVAKMPRNVNLIAGNATDLPFSEKEFDLVYSNGLSGYLTEEEHTRFYSEVMRVLKSGGSYFETLGERRENRPVPSNAKNLLVYLIGEMITGGTRGRSFSPIWEATFLREKFKMISYKVSGTSAKRWIKWVVEFRKGGGSL